MQITFFAKVKRMMVLTNEEDAGGQEVLMPNDQETCMIAESLWMWSWRKQMCKKQILIECGYN